MAAAALGAATLAASGPVANAHATFRESEARQAVRTVASPLADGMDGRLIVGRCEVRATKAVCAQVRIVAPSGRCRIRATVRDSADYYTVRFARVVCG